MIEANKRDIKNTWIILKQAMGKTNNKSNFPNNFMINNELITDPSVIAESFNTFFSMIGKPTSKSVPSTHNNFADYLTKPTKNSMYLKPIEPIQVLDIVQKLKPKSKFWP